MNWRLLPLIAITMSSCQQAAEIDARELVVRYNRVVCEAYRRGDVKLIDAVVAPNSRDGKNIAGLIGVRLDMGQILDAHLISLEITGIERSREATRVRTKESWRHRDLKIGTGEQIGDESFDSYEMLYVFRKFNTEWLLDETCFVAPPEVSRKTTVFAGDQGAMHRISMPPAGKGSQQP